MILPSSNSVIASTLTCPDWQDYSFEITAKEVDELTRASALIAPGSDVSITSLPGEDEAARLLAAKEVRRFGFVPVPHISARRIESVRELDNFLTSLVVHADADRAFLVAGDAIKSAGPYSDSLAVIRSGLLRKHGIKRVGIAGYPEAHPTIPKVDIWSALETKNRMLLEQGHNVEIVTQFGFDADPIISWLEQVRALRIVAPIRIGLPGPTSVKTLLRFAARCGVGTSAKVLAKYGISATKLLGGAGPDALAQEIMSRLDISRHGIVKFHMYSFGGLVKTASWTKDFSAPREHVQDRLRRTNRTFPHVQDERL